jgi:uncharacterized membrane protein (DUF2068 family)
VSDPSPPQYPQYPQYPSYPSYPPAPPAEAPQAPQAPLRPASVTNAMRLMYVGAGLSLVGLVASAANSSAFKTAIRKADPRFTTAQVNSAANVAVAVAVLFGLLGVGLWLWMAWANGRGRNWARVVSTVFFGIDTLGLASDLAQHVPAVSMVLALLVWVVGLAAVILLWRRDSNVFFTPQKYA